jgi:hypothetical protein
MNNSHFTGHNQSPAHEGVQPVLHRVAEIDRAEQTIDMVISTMQPPEATTSQAGRIVTEQAVAPMPSQEAPAPETTISTSEADERATEARRRITESYDESHPQAA